MITKKCTQCGIEKHIDKFVKDKSKKSGYRNQCKECINLINRKTPVKPKPKEGYKYCAKCNHELPLVDFNFRTYKGTLKPYSYCKECERKKDVERYDHTCANCQKQYKSGKKESKVCKTCHSVQLGQMGKKNLEKLNANQSGENNRMYGVQRFGKANPNYNPHKTDEEREKERLIGGYSIWRTQVYTRDNYICICCGFDRGGKLVAHHLNSWDWSKEERLDVNNGVTLCKDCHDSFHKTYGFGKNTKQQFNEFIKTFQKTIR